MFSECLLERLLFCEVNWVCQSGRPRSNSIVMLHYVTGNTVILVGLAGMHKDRHPQSGSDYHTALS